MKISKILFRKVLPMFLCFVLVFGLCVSNVSAVEKEDAAEEVTTEITVEETGEEEITSEEESSIEEATTESSEESEDIDVPEEEASEEEIAELQDTSAFNKIPVTLKWECDASMILDTVTLTLCFQDETEVNDCEPIVFQKSEWGSKTVWSGTFTGSFYVDSPYIVKQTTTSGEITEDKTTTVENIIMTQTYSDQSLTVVNDSTDDLYSEIPVKVTWNCKAAKIPAQIDLQLLDDQDQNAAEVLSLKSEDFKDKTEWKGTIVPKTGESFSKKTVYKIKQTSDGKELEEYKFTVKGTDEPKDGSFAIKNSYDPGEYKTITIQKTWKGEKILESLDIHVTVDDAKEAYVLSLSAKDAVKVEGSTDVIWQGSIEPKKGESFSKDSKYTVEEYYKGKEVADLKDNYNISIDDIDENGLIKITNTYVPEGDDDNYGSIRIDKVYVGRKPLDSIKFTLYRNQETKPIASVEMQADEFSELVTTENETEAETEDGEDEEDFVGVSSIDEDDEDFDDLEEEEYDDTEETSAYVKESYAGNTYLYPENDEKFAKKDTYYLVETAGDATMDAYNITVSGLLELKVDEEGQAYFDVVNTYDAPTTTLFLKKYWKGGTADSISVSLYQNGSFYQSYEIYKEEAATDKGYWYYEFSGLPVGFSYKIAESADGFSASAATFTTMNGKKGWSITNTYVGNGSDTTETNTDSAKTGDDNNLLIYIIILIAAAAVVAGILIYKKKNK